MEEARQSNKIPYDDRPILRVNKKKVFYNSKNSSIIKALAICLAVFFVLNVATIITCFVYVKNGKIKYVNIYYDTFETQEVNYMTDSMRTAKQSAVCVSVGRKNSLSFLVGDNISNSEFFNETKSHGSGFLYKIVGDDAYFVTCLHVINYLSDLSTIYNQPIWLLPASMQKPIKASLVAYSEKEDVAVLKYTKSNALESLEGMIPVTKYDSTFVTEYEDVFTIGNPLNGGLTGSSGKLSQYRDIFKPFENSNEEKSWIKTTTPINPGNSGGGLFDYNGRLIGMVNANIPSISNGDPVSNIAYAIPGTLVCSIADSIIYNYGQNKNQSGLLTMIDFGFSLVVDESMGTERYKYNKYQDKNGVDVDIDQQFININAFSNSSIAKFAGLKKNDRLIEMTVKLIGESEEVTIPIVNKYTIYEYCYAIEPGTDVIFHISRQDASNQTQELSVTVNASKIVQL